MPIFEIEASDGKIWEVDAPDASRAAAAFKKMDGSRVGTGEDIAKSSGVGLAKGAIGILGAPGDIGTLVSRGAEAVGVPEDFRKLAGKAFAANPLTRPFAVGPGSQEIQRRVEEYTGEFRKPQTTAGKYAGTAAEFVPGALVPASRAGGVAGFLRQTPGNIAKYAVIPGAASEAAGQATAGSWVEPYARAGAAVGTGGAAMLLSRPATAATSIRRGVEGATPQQLDAAENLFMEAQRAGQPISRAEAIQAVTNGATTMGDLQRVVEGGGGMRQFFAPRAAQNEAAFGPVARSIDPTPTTQPGTIGRAVSTAAKGTITDVRQAINVAADPFYTAASTQRIPPADMGRLRMAPGWREARDAVRNNPQLARYVGGLPDNSVGFVNEVKKYLDTAAKNAASTINAQRNQQIAAGYGSDARLARQTGINASPDYDVALNIEQQARQRYLEPLLAGPLGKIASRDTTTKKAINALFPANPLPNSADEITTAVTALSQRNAVAARQLVGAHAERVFNDATRNLISGPNQFGGAKFAAAIRGNPQQAANLEAAVRALPNGDQVWTGFDRFLRIVEAQGTRQRIGSQTAFNQEVLQDLRRGTTAQEVGSAVATGGFKLPTKIKDTLERWRLGRGVDEIARLLTNPEAGRRFRQIAEMPTGGRDATGVVARLVYLASEGANSAGPRDK